jgi:hypothetical protein
MFQNVLINSSIFKQRPKLRRKPAFLYIMAQPNFDDIKNCLSNKSIHIPMRPFY